MIKNKTRLTLITFSMTLLILLSLNNIVSAQSTNYCKLNISLVNQDPYPAVPGEYVKIVFQVTGLDNQNCDGAILMLDPAYPFFLDNNDPTRSIEGNTFIAYYDTAWQSAYKLRVDKDAISGENEIIMNYKQKISEDFITKRFNIEVEDSRTSFDAVIQEITDTEVSIAIANTGKHTANSVIVRIPEQIDFKATGTDGQMVGNLDSGDYTIVSFSAIKIPNKDSKSLLALDIHYTDNIGERRIVELDLPLASGTTNTNSTGFTPGTFTGRGTRLSQTTTDSSKIYTQWYFWIIIILVAGSIHLLIKRYRNKKKNSSKEPGWMKESDHKK